MTLRIILAAFVLLSFQSSLIAQDRPVPRQQPDIRLKGDRNLEIGRPAPNLKGAELQQKACTQKCERDRRFCRDNRRPGCDLTANLCLDECKKPRMPLRSGPRPIEQPR